MPTVLYQTQVLSHRCCFGVALAGNPSTSGICTNLRFRSRSAGCPIAARPVVRISGSAVPVWEKAAYAFLRKCCLWLVPALYRLDSPESALLCRPVAAACRRLDPFSARHGQWRGAAVPIVPENEKCLLLDFLCGNWALLGIGSLLMLFCETLHLPERIALALTLTLLYFAGSMELLKKNEIRSGMTAGNAVLRKADCMAVGIVLRVLFAEGAAERWLAGAGGSADSVRLLEIPQTGSHLWLDIGAGQHL